MLESKHSLAYDDPSKTFLGVRFILYGFDSVKEEKVRSMLLEGGGIEAVNYGPDCNHVIVDKLVYDDPICVAARRDEKILVTGLWVFHSFDVGMPVDPTSVMYWPMRDLNGIPGAKFVVVCLTGYQRQDRDDIMTMVALMGANFSKPLVANKVTHLVCYKFEGEKYELAKKIKRIKLVNHRWLEDCLKAWELLPESDYTKSGFELEMEAEAKDSEEETEDIASVDLRRKSVVNPQERQAENKKFHQSPVAQEVSKNTVYLSASENFANVGDTSKIQVTPRKETDNGNMSFSRGTHDKHLEKSTSSCARSPGKTSFEVPSNMLNATPISEKVDRVIASASRSAKKSPDADLSKLSIKNGKSSLPLRSRRNDHCSGGPSALNVSEHGFGDGFDMPSEKQQDGTCSLEVKTPLKGTLLHLDEGLTNTVSLPSKRKAIVTRGSSRSPIPNQPPNSLVGSGSATKTMELPVSGSSIYGSRRLGSDVSPLNVTSHLREEASGGFDVPSDGIDPDGVKTPLKGTLLHLDEEQTGSFPSKRKATVSRGSSKSPLSSHYPKTSIGSRLATKMAKLLAPGSSIDGSPQLAGDISPMNIAGSLREEASLPPKDKSEDRHECDDQALQHSRKGIENQTSSNLEQEMHRSDPQNTGLPCPRTSPGVEKMDGQADLNSSKVENKGNKSQPQKRKMLSRKTLGSRPTIGKGITSKHKGLINLQNDVLPDGAVTIGDTETATILKKVATLSPTTNEEGPMNDQTKTPDQRGQNEVEMGRDEEDSSKAEAPPHSGKGVARAKKPAKGKTIQMKKGAKSLEVENSNEAEKFVYSDKTKLLESKSTGDAGEKKTTKGKKRPLTKSKTNKSKDAREETKNDESNIKQDEKILSSNEETVVLAGTRPSKKLKSSADEEKENNPATVRQQNVSRDAKETTSSTPKKPIKDVKLNKNDPENVETKTVSAWFILSGHRLQRKEFQQVIKRLKGRVCRDSHNWSYQATHFIVPDPIRRTEKFFAAAASGSWILKTDYLTASIEAGRFLSEEPYEWHKKCLTEDGAINLEAPRKWRLLRERTGHGAFYGMRIVIYGECIAPPLDTLKRVVKAGEGTILATSPPYTRFLKSGIDFAIISPGMPRADMWVQSFLEHEVPCIVADYLVDYVCKPGYSLEKHVQYKTQEWAQRALENLLKRVEEVVDEPITSEEDSADVACRACGARDRGDKMLICGDESGSNGCGVGIHIDCLDPPLPDVPVEDWYCRECCRKRDTKTASRSSKKRVSKSKL